MERVIAGLLIIVLIGVIYFLPTIVAYDRKIDGRGWILLLNLLFAGTGIVYFILLIWDFTARPGKEAHMRL